MTVCRTGPFGQPTELILDSISHACAEADTQLLEKMSSSYDPSVDRGALRRRAAEIGRRRLGTQPLSPDLATRRTGLKRSDDQAVAARRRLARCYAALQASPRRPDWDALTRLARGAEAAAAAARPSIDGESPAALRREARFVAAHVDLAEALYRCDLGATASALVSATKARAALCGEGAESPSLKAAQQILLGGLRRAPVQDPHPVRRGLRGGGDGVGLGGRRRARARVDARSARGRHQGLPGGGRRQIATARRAAAGVAARRRARRLGLRGLARLAVRARRRPRRAAGRRAAGAALRAGVGSAPQERGRSQEAAGRLRGDRAAEFRGLVARRRARALRGPRGGGRGALPRRAVRRGDALALLAGRRRRRRDDVLRRAELRGARRGLLRRRRRRAAAPPPPGVARRRLREVRRGIRQPFRDATAGAFVPRALASVAAAPVEKADASAAARAPERRCFCWG